MMALSEKVVLVTGGGTGIGLGIATSFLNAGYKVIITGRRKEKLEESKSLVTDDLTASRMFTMSCDVADREAVEAMFSRVREQFGFVDILVNCAGTNIVKRKMSEMTPEQWDEVLAINVTGAYNCMYQVLPAMREKNEGIIINVSSIAGKRALALGGIAYASSKFAMTALGTAVGNEVAPDGVRVTNVYPGEVNTPILEKRPNPVSDAQKSKMVQPEDVGTLVVAIAELPARAHVPEIIIKPTVQEYV